MPTFRYEATDSAGSRHEGEVDASDVAAAIDMLGQQGLKVEMVRAVGTRTPTQIPAVDQGLIHHVQDALDRRELILPPLLAIQEEFSDRNDGGIRDLIALLQSEPQADAWIHHQHAAAWLPILLGGARGGQGQLTALLSHAIDRRKTAWQRYLRWIYPMVVLTLSLMVTLLLGCLVIPIFAHMYSDFGLQLPGPTVWSFWFSNQLLEHPIHSVVVLLAVVILLFIGPRLASRFACRWCGLFSGSASGVRAMARITSSLADLLHVGASLPEALRIAGNGSGHAYYRHQLIAMAQMAETEPPAVFRQFAMRSFPGNVVEAIRDEKGANANIGLLRELSALYQRRIEQKSHWLVGAIGPIAIMALGAVVAFIVVSLFMPMFFLISGLSS